MNYWEHVGNECLKKAAAVLDEKTTLTPEEAKVVNLLVATAASIDELNRHWASQSQFTGPTSSLFVKQSDELR